MRKVVTRFAQVVAGGDAQGGHPGAGQFAEQRAQRGGLVEHPGEGTQRRLARGAAADASPHLLEEGHPEVLLDALQLLRHRRGRLVQASGGLADGACLGHHQGVVKGGQQRGIDHDPQCFSKT
jgi:hypothetical protein